MARRREAFLASERARRAQEPADYYHESRRSSLTAPRDHHAPRSQKSLMMAYLLWFFAAGISAHRFYLGAYQSAVIQVSLSIMGLALLWVGKPIGLEPLALVALALMACAWLWILADVFLIPGLHRRHDRPHEFEASSVFG